MISPRLIQAEMASEGCGEMQAYNNIKNRQIVADRERRKWNRRTRWLHVAGDRRDGERRHP